MQSALPLLIPMAPTSLLPSSFFSYSKQIRSHWSSQVSRSLWFLGFLLRFGLELIGFNPKEHARAFPPARLSLQQYFNGKFLPGYFLPGASNLNCAHSWSHQRTECCKEFPLHHLDFPKVLFLDTLFSRSMLRESTGPKVCWMFFKKKNAPHLGLQETHYPVFYDA